MKSLKKGFTLVELMVVIVIIGILAALAIPRFLGATNKTKATEFKPVLKQIYTLETAFQQESPTGVYGTLQAVGWDVPGRDAAAANTAAYFNYGLGVAAVGTTIANQTTALTVAPPVIAAGASATLANASPNANGLNIRGANGVALANGTDFACLVNDGTMGVVGASLQSIAGASLTAMANCP